MHAFNDLKKLARRHCDGTPVKVALVGDTATQFLAVAMRGTAVSMGINMELWEADYSQVEYQLQDPASELHCFGAQYIVVYQSSHKWCQLHASLSYDRQAALADERLLFLSNVCNSTPARIIYLNYAEIDDAVFGSYANQEAGSFLYQQRKMNYELMLLAQRTPNLFICDLAAVQSLLGRNQTFDAAIYSSTEMVLSLDAVPYVAKRILDVIAAAQGMIKKCLILDLDNTLWGGIIGEDGLEGIQLGHTLGIGKVFTELQLWVKKLKERGIILCVCSKNDEATARQPFEQHPDMVLKMDDIAVFMANWETKVDNIRHIQQVLNIGFDSMVFLDDNPAERQIVRDNIAGITVPELPCDPALWLEYLYCENLFETVSCSSADRERTRQYQAQAQRVAFARSFANEAEFLTSLEMTCRVEAFTAFNIPRAAQLTQRSNQFNLRTIRYTEADIASLATAPQVTGITLSLKDKFGDNGLIAVVVMRRMNADTLFVDTWVMSCRVLKRSMEAFTLNTMVQAARKQGCKRIVGQYIPTPKNAVVKDLYPDLGFTPIREKALLRQLADLHIDSKNCYELMLSNFTPLICYIRQSS